MISEIVTITEDLDNEFPSVLISKRDYEIMRTALTTLHEFMNRQTPEDLEEIIGVLQKPTNENEKVALLPPPVYRLYQDKWACKDCKVKADKWAMLDHVCSKSLKSKSKSRAK